MRTVGASSWSSPTSVTPSVRDLRAPRADPGRTQPQTTTRRSKTGELRDGSAAKTVSPQVVRCTKTDGRRRLRRRRRQSTRARHAGQWRVNRLANRGTNSRRDGGRGEVAYRRTSELT